MLVLALDSSTTVASTASFSTYKQIRGAEETTLGSSSQLQIHFRIVTSPLLSSALPSSLSASLFSCFRSGGISVPAIDPVVA